MSHPLIVVFIADKLGQFNVTASRLLINVGAAKILKPIENVIKTLKNIELYSVTTEMKRLLT